MAASATLPAVRSPTSRPVSVASMDLRDRPTASATPKLLESREMLEQHEVVDDALAETESRIDGEPRGIDAGLAASGNTRGENTR